MASCHGAEMGAEPMSGVFGKVEVVGSFTCLKDRLSLVRFQPFPSSFLGVVDTRPLAILLDFRSGDESSNLSGSISVSGLV